MSMHQRSRRSLWIGLLFCGQITAAAAPLVASGPHADAPPQLRQFGQLVGDWTCRGSNQQADGSWLESPNAPATWSWYYVLDGYAVQDVWKPGVESAPWGTNLRTYDPETGKWHMVWATQRQARFDEFTASYSDGALVMLGERWTRPAFQAHSARITFYNIGQTHYDWKYEVAQGEDSWNEINRLSCDRS